jgi:hypothetical protein
MTQPVYWLRRWNLDPNFIFLVYPSEHIPSLEDYRTAFPDAAEAQFRKHWIGLSSYMDTKWGSYGLGLMTFHLLKVAYDRSKSAEDIFYYVSQDSIPIAPRAEWSHGSPATI